MKILMAALIYLFLATATYAQTTRAILAEVLPNEIGEQAQLYQNSHALLIGISDYQNGWPDLPGVRKDMALLQEALEQNGFEVTHINDPISEDLKKIFDLFIILYGRDPENRLLIYFAGLAEFLTNEIVEQA